MTARPRRWLVAGAAAAVVAALAVTIAPDSPVAAFSMAALVLWLFLSALGRAASVAVADLPGRGAAPAVLPHSRRDPVRVRGGVRSGRAVHPCRPVPLGPVGAGPRTAGRRARRAAAGWWCRSTSWCRPRSWRPSTGSPTIRPPHFQDRCGGSRSKTLRTGTQPSTGSPTPTWLWGLPEFDGMVSWDGSVYRVLASSPGDGEWLAVLVPLDPEAADRGRGAGLVPGVGPC